MTDRPSCKDIAAEAIASALGHAKTLEPSRWQRYILADLETARDAVAEIQELKRPRRAAKKKAKKSGLLDDPDVTR